MAVTLTPSEEAQLLQTIEMFEVITQSQPMDCQSLEILKEAYSKLARESDVVNTSKRIAEAYVQLGQLSSAILEYESILQRSPDDPDVQKALEIENASPYGNAASVFTESGGVARYVMEHASAGMVGVNVGVPVPREPFSFGGWNESKFGVGDITGRGSIEFWTQAKKMTTKWNREAGVNWMS